MTRRIHLLLSQHTRGVLSLPALLLVAGLLGAFAPARSAFGEIAFTTDRDGNREVYVMNADGSAQANLTNNAVGNDSLPVWSPDGQKLAFASDRDGNAEIYVMNANGSAQMNLTNNPAFDSEPAWSRDSTKLAFESERDGNREIYVMSADGSAPTNLTSNPAGEGEPAWSPDGTKLAFASDRDGNFEIYVMNADGSAQTNLTNNPAFDFEPDWRPLPRPIGTTFGPPNSANPSGTAAEPVNTAIRDYFFQSTDLTLPGRGLPVIFIRTYNSLDVWSHGSGAGRRG